MDWNELIETGKNEIAKIDPGVTGDMLDMFWNGSVMEIRRFLYRHSERDILYMVEINTMTKAVSAKKYLPQ